MAIRREMLEAFLVGNALGRPADGFKRGHLRQLMGGEIDSHLTNPILFPEHPEWNVLPGLHGVDGQVLFAAISAHKNADESRGFGAQVGSHLATLAGEDAEAFGVLRSPGKPLREAVAKWRSDYPWNEKDFFATKQPSEGIHACAAALVPFAMGSANQSADAVSLARLTHARMLPVSSAFALATLGELLAADGGKKINAPNLMAKLIERVQDFEIDFARANRRQWDENGWTEKPRSLTHSLHSMATLLREGNDLIAEATILKTAQDYAPALSVTHVQHGFCAVAVPWIVYLALGTPSPRNRIEEVINRGGQCSIIASLLAGLFAARYDREHIPDEWIEGTLALPALYRCLDDPDFGIESIAAQEATWNAKEDALRKPIRDAIERQRKSDIEAGRGTGAEKPRKSARDEDEQEESSFAPPPHLWLKPGEEEDPEKKRIIKTARGRRRIEWKEARRKDDRERRE